MSNNCALLARLHRNGTLYLLVPLSFLLIMTTTLGLSRFASVPLGFGISLATPQRLLLAFGSAEIVALYLLVPLLFAVLNPSGIARGLAAASLGLAPIHHRLYRPQRRAEVRLKRRLAVDIRDSSGPRPLGTARHPCRNSARASELPRRMDRPDEPRPKEAHRPSDSRGRARSPVLRHPLEQCNGARRFAGIGLLMQQYKWPRLPLWFGLAIGPTIERSGVIAWATTGLTGLLSRPIVLGIVALVLGRCGLRVPTEQK